MLILWIMALLSLHVFLGVQTCMNLNIAAAQALTVAETSIDPLFRKASRVAAKDIVLGSYVSCSEGLRKQQTVKACRTAQDRTIQRQRNSAAHEENCLADRVSTAF